MKKWLFLCFVVSLSGFVSGQIAAFDKLEMLYAQKHYKMVYRKANRLLDNPEFDFSQVPAYYRAISTFQLSQNVFWFKRHQHSFDDAVHLFKAIKQDVRGKDLLKAHSRELEALKLQLHISSDQIKTGNDSLLAKRFNDVIGELFDLKGVESNLTKDTKKNTHSEKAVERLTMIEVAKKYIGTPYMISGTDPNGFDCSGFTCFVMQKAGKTVPRTAAEQFESSHKLSKENVRPGDLVFFDNGQGISHVGMIISEPGEPLIMIHSSSSKGVVITELEKSEYWLKRLSGFGTYFR